MNRPASRVVLFTSIPSDRANRTCIRNLFTQSLTNCWIPKPTRKLKALVRKRENAAKRLEKTQITFIQQQNTAHSKQELTRVAFPWFHCRVTKQPSCSPKDMESGTADRKSHKLSRSTDLIRTQLQSLNEKISVLRKEYYTAEWKSINAVFVQFASFSDAQIQHQIPAYQLLSQTSRTFIGIRPGEVIWSSLELKPWQKLARQSLIQILLIIAVGIWWMPTALVNLVTDPDMVENYPSIGELPDFPRIVLSSLGRAVLLIILLEPVPTFLRACGKFTGEPTLRTLESFVQKRYFVFQVIQVFAAPIVIPDPLLLLRMDTYIPLDITSKFIRSSALYYTYIIVKCLQASAGELIQFAGLYHHYIRSLNSDTLRTRQERWYRLGVVHWGTLYPIFTNIGVIESQITDWSPEAISYALVAPIILLFTAMGLCCVYIAYKYSLIYVYDTNTLDNNGIYYPQAVKQLITGVYLAQVHLMLFMLVHSARTQALLMGLEILVTVFIHRSIDKPLNRFFDSVPRAASHENESFSTTIDTHMSEDSEDPGEPNARTIIRDREQNVSKRQSFFERLFQVVALPSVGDLKQKIPETPNERELPSVYASQRYHPPEAWLPEPRLWIPRDDSGISQQEISLTKDVLPISDDGAWLDEKGQVKFDIDDVSFKEDLFLRQYMHPAL
ncbi:hypothetical protein HJFPF1_02326 [Paramyrothecium foliicola]|nr:hypothetical protein HJFPF1_02326 [Paramyrothecium foliicola]